MAEAAMIEKVAREICVGNGDDPDEKIGWAAQYPAWTYATAHVRQTLEAIERLGLIVVPRNPTAEMKHAGRILNSQVGLEMAEACYRAMLVAATPPRAEKEKE